MRATASREPPPTPTGAVRWLAGRWVRRRALSMGPLALVLAVGTGASGVALSTADRTAHAYRDHLVDAQVGDVVINPSVNTAEVAELISSLPNVERVTSASALVVTPDDGRARRAGEIALNSLDSATGWIGSSDGRFFDMDRLVVREGRLPTSADEVVVSAQASAVDELHVGDELTVAFWSSGIEAAAGELAGLGLGPGPDDLVEPIGVETVEVVGVVAQHDDLLTDDLYPRQLIVTSPELAARYECTPASPPPGSTFAEAFAALHPSDCATGYRFYSMALAGGSRHVKGALDEFLRRAVAMNASLADISDLESVGVEPPQYYLIPTETEAEARRVELAVGPSVTALRALGIALILVTIVLASLAVQRELQRTGRERRLWFELGLSASNRATIAALPPVGGTLVGALVGALAGSLVDSGPVGLLDALAPEPVRGLRPPGALALGAAVMLVVLSSCLLVARAVQRDPRPPLARTGDRRRTVGWPGAPLSVSVGIGSVGRTGTTAPVLACATLLCAAFVAAIVFGSSLSTLVSTPGSYGWPWDVAATTGYGYGGLDLDGARDQLDGDPDVASWSALGLMNDVSLDGRPWTSLVAFDSVAPTDLPLVEGALPRRRDEVAIGSAVATDQDLGVGDVVRLGGAFGDRRSTVTGIVVLPTLGPYMADRVSAGSGLLLSDRALVDLDAPYDTVDPRYIATFVAVDLRDDAPPGAVGRLGDVLNGLDLDGQPIFAYDAPVRPAQVVDVGSTRTVPFGVGALFAIATGICFAFLSWSSVRASRRDTAVLQALGFSRKQVARSVVVRSLAVAVPTIGVGVTLGVAAGQRLWRQFAMDLGVVPDPSSPWIVMVACAAGGLVSAVLAALLPARSAARAAPRDGLHATHT